MPRLAIADPPLPSASTASSQAKPPEKASVDTLARPSRTASPAAIALSDPKLAPDQLPDAILNRVIAPAKIVPHPILAEAQPPAAVASKAGLEAIALERPSYAAAVEAATLEDASPLSPSEAYAAYHPNKAAGPGVAAALADAEPPGSPEAIADRHGAGQEGAVSDLQTPDVPSASESIVALKAQNSQTGGVAELAEPGDVSPSQVGTGPVAISEGQPSPGPGASAELGEPLVPSPTESLASGRPAQVDDGKWLVYF